MTKWMIKNLKPKEDMAPLKHAVHPLILKILYNRHINTVEDIVAFLQPDLANLPRPEELFGVEDACNLLLAKKEGNPHIRVIGDYDVDGTMGTFILVDTLRRLGFQADYAIPHRVHDGYGLNERLVKMAYEDGVDILITVDNGIVAIDAVQQAKDLGMLVVITDHHEPLVKDGTMLLPLADVVIDPKRLDYPYDGIEICGAYVALKLVWVLVEKSGLDVSEYLHRLLGPVALATVCDIMDLLGENRVVVHHGIDSLEDTDIIGLKALCEGCGIKDKHLSAYHLGFILGPTINAVGRLSHAEEVLELMFEEDEELAKDRVVEMRALNQERMTMTEEGILESYHILNHAKWKNDLIYIIHLPDIHESVAGIIAGRLKEELYRPIIVLTGRENTLKGSGRSIDGYNMIKGLQEQDEELIKYGGHGMAAGLSVSVDNLEHFREKLNQACPLTEEDLVKPVSVDGILPFYSITLPMVEAIEKLGPFGKGNPTPVFAQTKVMIEGGQILGKNKSVLKLNLRDRTTAMTGLLFSGVDDFFSCILNKYDKITQEQILEGKAGEIVIDVVFKVTINEFHGKRSPQLTIAHYR